MRSRRSHQLILATLITLGVSASSSESAAQRSSSEALPQLSVESAAIRNGVTVPRTLFLPVDQLAAIGKLSAEGISQFCTATVISASAVITARHCFENELILNAMGHKLQLNLSDALSGVPNSYPFQLGNVELNTGLDLAIITFPERPFATIQGLRPIPINRAPLEGSFYDNLIGHQVTGAGYGATYEQNQSGLRFASVRVELITSRSIVVNGERNQGLCSGDSGGPIIAPGVDGNPSLIAVVSKGDPCCVGIDQITRLDPAQEWIDRLTNANIDVRPPNQAWSEGCAGISQLGSCSDNLLRQCADGAVFERDCGAQLCDYNRITQSVDCIERCPGVHPRGQCVGLNQLQRCVRGEVITTDCDPNSQCRPIEFTGAPACVSNSPQPALEGRPIPNCIEDEEGRITEASEARFVATSCAQGDPLTPLTALSLSALYLLSRASRRRRALSNPS